MPVSGRFQLCFAQIFCQNGLVDRVEVRIERPFLVVLYRNHRLCRIFHLDLRLFPPSRSYLAKSEQTVKFDVDQSVNNRPAVSTLQAMLLTNGPRLDLLFRSVRPKSAKSAVIAEGMDVLDDGLPRKRYRTYAIR
jgi:hypothetical protein